MMSLTVHLKRVRHAEFVSASHEKGFDDSGDPETSSG